MKYEFRFHGKGTTVSLRGAYTLEDLRQQGCNEFRTVPTGKWIDTKNGRRKMETKGVEYVTTAAGRFERSEWHRLLEEAVFCEEKGWLLNVLMDHVRTHCAWLHTNREIRNYALECLSSGAYHSWKL